MHNINTTSFACLTDSRPGSLAQHTLSFFPQVTQLLEPECIQLHLFWPFARKKKKKGGARRNWYATVSCRTISALEKEVAKSSQGRLHRTKNTGARQTTVNNKILMFWVTFQSFGITEPQQSWCCPSTMPSTDLNNDLKPKLAHLNKWLNKNKVNFNDILLWKCYLEYWVSVIMVQQSFLTQKLAIVTMWTPFSMHFLLVSYFFFLLIFSPLIHNESHRKFITNGIFDRLSIYLLIFKGKHNNLRYSCAFSLPKYRKEQRKLKKINKSEMSEDFRIILGKQPGRLTMFSWGVAQSTPWKETV